MKQCHGFLQRVARWASDTATGTKVAEKGVERQVQATGGGCTRLSWLLRSMAPLPLNASWVGIAAELHGGSFLFFACASAHFYLLIGFPKLPFCAAQVICSASESPLVSTPRLPLTLAASSKGAWACCGACNVCSRIGRPATTSLPWGVSSASCSAPGETGRPLLLAQGQYPPVQMFPLPRDELPVFTW